MRILVYSHAPPGTGTATTSSRIAHHLSQCGHDVAVKKHWDLDVPTFEELCEPGSADLLIGTHAYQSGRAFCDGAVPFILVLSGTDLDVDSEDRSRLRIMSTAVERAEALVCYDESHLARARRLWPDAASRIIRIPKGVHTTPTSFSVRPQLHLGADDFLLVLPSGLRTVKDVLYVADEIDEWRADDPLVHLAIIGLPCEPDYARAVHERCERSDGLHLVDALRQSDLHGCMRDAAVVLNTSLSESSSNAVLEAMHLGCAVAVRDIPGNRALVEHAVTGLVFGIAADFRPVVSNLRDESYRTRLGTSATEHVLRVHRMSSERASYGELVERVAHG